MTSISTERKTDYASHEMTPSPGVFVVGMARSGTSAITGILLLRCCREGALLLWQRPRWWSWMAELIMSTPIARAARRLPAPQRRGARDAP